MGIKEVLSAPRSPWHASLHRTRDWYGAPRVSGSRDCLQRSLAVSPCEERLWATITSREHTCRWPRMRRSHAPSSRRNLAGSLPYRKLAVFTTGTNGAQPNKIGGARCFSRAPVCRATVSCRPNQEAACPIVDRRPACPEIPHSGSEVKDARLRLHSAFSRILLRMRFARSTISAKRSASNWSMCRPRCTCSSKPARNTPARMAARWSRPPSR